MYWAQIDTHRHRHEHKHKNKHIHWHRHRRRRKHRHITYMHEPIKQTEHEHPTEKRCSGHQGFTAVWNSVGLIITHSECWLNHNESCWPCEHTCHAGWWRSRAPMSRKIVFFLMNPPNKALLHPHRARVCGCDCMCMKGCVNTRADFGNLGILQNPECKELQRDKRPAAMTTEDTMRAVIVMGWFCAAREKSWRDGRCSEDMLKLHLLFRCDLCLQTLTALSVREDIISVQVLGADQWVL